MRKKIILWLFSVAISLFTFHSCSSEDDYIKSQDEKYTSNKFQIFLAQDGKTINYAEGFKSLMERYDSLYTVSHTTKTMHRSFSKSESIASEYIEFNIRSQEFTTDNNEKYVLFPLIRNYQVDGIMVATLREEETIVEYYEMSKDEKNYQEILNLFKVQYLKSTVKSRLNKSACGFDGYPPCDIDTVIITVPKTGGNGNGLPSGGSGGTSGGCSIYQNCIDGNLDGGGGGGVPELELSSCFRTKLMISKQQIKEKTNALFDQSKLTGEKGFMANSDGLTSPIVTGEDHSVDFGDISGYEGYYHNHTPDGVKIFSPGDIRKLFEFIIKLPAGISLDTAFGGMVSTEVCAGGCPDGYEYFHYIMTYIGNSSDAGTLYQHVHSLDLTTLTNDYRDYERSLRNSSGNSSQYGNYVGNKALEKLFYSTLNKMGIKSNQINLQRVDQNGNITNVTPDTNGNPQDSQCP
ncbi:hypothetical protein [Chryseobacterium sp. CT-SW4]|uniref:hypothetical protein n=1 Tax=Chryseobacterium sp. SW-1 TaxID=3157343 RepID=UPI003B01E632